LWSSTQIVKIHIWIDLIWKILVSRSDGILGSYWLHSEHCDKISVLSEIYVDDMLYFGTSDDSLLSFEIKLAECFNMDTKGQAHWNLAIRITQMISS
jgi:hypothetical protein